MSELPTPAAGPVPWMVAATTAELRGLPERVDDVRVLKGLTDRAAGVQRLAGRMRVGFDLQNDLAEARLVLSRKVGRLLMAQVHRGGCVMDGEGAGPKRGGSSAPLPPEISKMEALRFRRLARIPDAVVNTYVNGVRRGRRLLTIAGLLRAAAIHVGRDGAEADPRLMPLLPILSAARRTMEVHVVVGLPAPDDTVLADARHVEGDDAGSLCGNVLVVAEPDPRAWIERVAAAREVREAILVLPARSHADWLQALSRHDWTTCLIEGVAPRAVAYRGDRRHAFFLVFRELGTVVRTVRS